MESATELGYSKIRVAFDSNDQKILKPGHNHDNKSISVGRITSSSLHLKHYSTLGLSTPVLGSTQRPDAGHVQQQMFLFSPDKKKEPDPAYVENNEKKYRFQNTMVTPVTGFKNRNSIPRGPDENTNAPLTHDTKLSDITMNSRASNTAVDHSTHVLGDISEPFWVQSIKAGSMWGDPDDLFLKEAAEKLVSTNDRKVFWEMARSLIDMPLLRHYCKSAITEEVDLIAVLKKAENKILWTTDSAQYLPKSVASALIESAYVPRMDSEAVWDEAK